MPHNIFRLTGELTEDRFLSFLFDVGHGLIVEDSHEVILYSRIERSASPELLDHLNSQGAQRRVLFHLSDEKLRHRNSIYSRFDVVIRNYFDPRVAWRKNVVFLPLGWTAAFSEPIRRSGEAPRHGWSFCGAVKADRETMVKVFDSIPQGFHYFSTGWDSPDQIAPEIVRDIYEDSIFVLCPQGNAHVDTFRVMEALQAGAIPVTTRFLGRDFFRYTFGDHPFIVEKTWQEAAARVKSIMTNPDEALAYRKRVQVWYQDYLNNLVVTVGDVISGRVPVRQVRDRNRHVAASRFDLKLLVSITWRFRRYRKQPK